MVKKTFTDSGRNTIRLTNILAGEVWLCSDQSNMSMTMERGPWCSWSGGVFDPAKEIKAATGNPCDFSDSRQILRFAGLNIRGERAGNTRGRIRYPKTEEPKTE